MKKLLIVRSVNFLQLDINILKIKEQFPNYQIDILTNSKTADTAKKYECVTNVYPYNFSGSFDKKNIVKEIQDKEFDVIIILVNNVSGLFFENVIHFGYSIKAKEYYICNIVSELKKITKFDLIKNDLVNLVVKICSFILTIPIGMYIICIKTIPFYKFFKE